MQGIETFTTFPLFGTVGRMQGKAFRPMSKSSRLSIRFFAAALGVASIIFGPTLALSETGVARLCKPVSPQITVRLDGAPMPNAFTQLLVRYDEKGSLPFSRETFSHDVRTSFCDVNGGRCVASRARYESRAEGSRYQSIQLRKMVAEGNPIVGGVRWSGPSYPDHVTISCNLAISDARTACTIVDIVYSPEGSGSLGNGTLENVRRHDQCRPDILPRGPADAA